MVIAVRSFNIPEAAICTETILLAEIGLLNHISHTGIAKEYLKAMAPNYQGERFNFDQRSVSANGIVTASGIAPIEFARDIMKELKVYENALIEKWNQLF